MASPGKLQGNSLASLLPQNIPLPVSDCSLHPRFRLKKHINAPLEENFADKMARFFSFSTVWSNGGFHHFPDRKTNKQNILTQSKTIREPKTIAVIYLWSVIIL